MRLKLNCLKWPLKTRLWIGGVLWTIILVIAFFCSTTGHHLIDWTKGKVDVAFQKADYRLKQIEVNWKDDIHYTKTEDILKTIDLSQGDNMSSVHLDQLQEKLEKLPWIRSVIIERYWPNVLKITITEKMPLALWQHNHKYHPLDERAEIINTTNQLPADLLLVVGPDAPQNLIPLIQNLEQVPDIYQYVRAAVRVGERRWNLKLFNAEKGLEVLLPETNILGALQRLNEHNKKEKLIKRQIAAIDLRTKDKVILKPIPTPQPKQKATKK